MCLPQLRTTSHQSTTTGRARQTNFTFLRDGRSTPRLAMVTLQLPASYQFFSDATSRAGNKLWIQKKKFASHPLGLLNESSHSFLASSHRPVSVNIKLLLHFIFCSLQAMPSSLLVVRNYFWRDVRAVTTLLSYPYEFVYEDPCLAFYVVRVYFPSLLNPCQSPAMD